MGASIVGYARDMDADLVVLGSRNLTGWKRCAAAAMPEVYDWLPRLYGCHALSWASWRLRSDNESIVTCIRHVLFCCSMADVLLA